MLKKIAFKSENYMGHAYFRHGYLAPFRTGRVKDDDAVRCVSHAWYVL